MKLAKIALFFCSVSVAVSNPGIKFRITNHILSGLSRVINRYLDNTATLLPKLMNKFQSQFPNSPIESVHSATVTALEHPSTDFKFQAPNKVYFDIRGGNVEAEIHATRRHTDIQAPIALKVAGVTLSLIVSFSKQGPGKLKIDLQHCHAQLSTLELNVDQLYPDGVPGEVSASISTLTTRVNEMAERMGCATVRRELMKLRLRLMRWDMLIDMSVLGGVFPKEGYALDVSLAEEPVATDDYFEFGINGKIQKTGGSCSNDAFTPPALVDRSDNNRMAHIFVSDDVPNEMFQQMHCNGDLSKTYSEGEMAGIMTQVEEINDSMGWDFQHGDTLDMSLSFAEPPTVRFTDEEGRNVQFDFKVDITSTHKRGGEAISNVISHLRGAGYHDMEVTNTDDQEFPQVIESGEITEAEVLGVDNYPPGELTAEKKSTLEGKLKDLMQQHYNDILATMNKLWSEGTGSDLEAVIFSVFSVRNAYAHFFDHTSELAFDIKLNSTNAHNFLEQIMP